MADHVGSDDAGRHDPLVARIFAAVERARTGDSRGAAEEFDALWRELGPEADPFHRCTLANYAADVQDEVSDELAWDVSALEAARQLSDARVKQHEPSLAIAGFFPSLHLNLAEDYRKLGDLGKARQHIVASRDNLAALPEDEYGRAIRAEIEHTGALLGEESADQYVSRPALG